MPVTLLIYNKKNSKGIGHYSLQILFQLKNNYSVQYLSDRYLSTDFKTFFYVENTKQRAEK